MKILVSEPKYLAESIEEKLNSIGQVCKGPFSRQGLIQNLAGHDVLMVRLSHRIDAEVLAAAPDLKYLVTATTGLDHIDLQAVQFRSVQLISLRDCMHRIQDVSATAELCWALLLCLVRKLPGAIEHVQSGGWDRDRFFGTQLRGKTLGVLGMGRIGSMVAKFGEVFGMSVIFHDILPENRVGEGYRNLDDLFRESDILSVHVTANEENRGLVNVEKLNLMKTGALLINTSRGWILNEADVADALVAGKLAGVAVDVVEGEESGKSDSPLRALAASTESLLVSPHIGGATLESLAQAEGAVTDELLNRLVSEGYIS